jgi:WD40 repeat protein
MLLAVATLVVVEVVVLWRVGVTYTPKSQVNDIGIFNFAFASNGRWGLSRLFYRRSELEQSCGWELLLHDMQPPNTTRCLDLSHLHPMLMSASARGDHLAIASMNGVIRSWDELEASTLPRVIVDARADVLTALAHSPDGEWLFGASDTAIYGWRTKNGELIHKLEHQGGRCSLSFSNDSTKLMFVGWDNRLRLFDIPRGELVEDRTLDGTPIFAASLAPNGERFATVATGGTVRLYNLKQASELWQTKVGAAAPIAFSQDGARVAIVNQLSHREFAIEIRQADTGRLAQQLSGHQQLVTGLAFAPDDTLISWDFDGNIRRWSPALQASIWDFSAQDWVRRHPMFGGNSSRIRDSSRGSSARPLGGIPALLTTGWLARTASWAFSI